MAKQKFRKLRQARGYWVDADLPEEAAGAITLLGYRVIYEGQTGRPDSLVLGDAKDHYVLITRDKGFLKAGAAPRRHRGIFVIDAGHDKKASLTRTVADLVHLLSQFKFRDEVFMNRRFLFSPGQLVEYMPDGTIKQSAL